MQISYTVLNPLGKMVAHDVRAIPDDSPVALMLALEGTACVSIMTDSRDTINYRKVQQ